MIPLEQLISPRVRAARNGFSVQFHPLATKRPTLSVALSGNLKCTTSRLSAQHQPTPCVRCSTVGFRLAPPENANLKPRRRGRGRAGTTDVRWSFGSSHFSTDGASMHSVSAATGTGADSSDGFSLESPRESSYGKDSTVVLSFSERQEKAPATDGEKLGEDNDDCKVKTTTVIHDGGEGNEAEKIVVEQEYSLTEKGDLSTVTVTRGGKTLRTDTHMARVLAEVGIQAESLQRKIQNFSVRKLISEWGKKQPELGDLKFNAAMYEAKEGVSSITQWTATELTLQRGQLLRISRDASYLVWAFSMYGAVRILEVLMTVFSSSPPNYAKLWDCMNALDPLTVASLAHALRKPIQGMLDVDPTNLEEVSSLKSKFWTELHKFYERQWKVVATLGVAKLLTLVVGYLPRAEWVTSKAKVVWDITMALPIF